MNNIAGANDKENLTPPGFDPRTIKPVAICHTY
jgi:hypothetical protein